MASKFHQTAFSLYERPSNDGIKWWRHESTIYKTLGLDSADELDEFVLQCGRGYCGVGDAKNLQTLSSNLGIHWRKFSRTRKSGGGCPRHYAFEYDNATPVPFKAQQEIIQWVQGIHRQLQKWPDMKKRRSKQ